jgi:valyl-tRNA synthetase
VTEEIWEKLPGTQGSIMQASWPRPDEQLAAAADLDNAEAQMGLIMDVITAVRNIRGEMNLGPSVKLEVTVITPDAGQQTVIGDHRDIIINLARLASLKVGAEEQRSPTAATAIAADATVLVELKGVIDFAQEEQRLQKEIGKLEKELIGIGKKLNNEGFLSKAPADVVENVRARQTDLLEKQEKLQKTLARVKSFI